MMDILSSVKADRFIRLLKLDNEDFYNHYNNNSQFLVEADNSS